MLGIYKKNEGESLVVQLKGNIDDLAPLDSIGRDHEQGPIEVWCRDVSRINSAGIQKWRHYFSELRRKGCRLTFHEVSAPLIEQLNFLEDFIRIDELRSVCAPFYCGDCKFEETKVFEVEELPKMNLSELASTCPNCARSTSFDELPEIYFGFLESGNGK